MRSNSLITGKSSLRLRLLTKFSLQSAQTLTSINQMYANTEKLDPIQNTLKRTGMYTHRP